MHAHAFKSTLPGCYLLWGHWSSHLVHPISVSLVGARASGLQFTGPPSMCWVIYYAMLPRMETQSQRQRIKQHSAAPLTSHPLPSHSAFLQACPGRQTHQAPALAIFSSTHARYNATSRHGFTPDSESPKLGARGQAALPLPGGGVVGTGRRVFLTCPSPVLGILSIHPTPALVQLHPVLQVPSSACEGPGPEPQEQVLLGTAQTRSPVWVHLARQGRRHQVQLR